MTATVLAVDVGSSSVRAALAGPDGEPLTGTLFSARHHVHYGPSGAAELDPDLVTDRIARVIDQALAAARVRRITVDAVAMDTMWHSMCGVGADGAVTIPVLTWADQRSAAAAITLANRIDDIAQHSRTGARLHTSYPPAKLLWLAEQRPDAVGATRTWLSPGAFAYSRFFGAATESVSMASGSGLMNQHTLCYDPEVVDAVGVPADRLPPIDDTPASGLLPAFRNRWPELADVPWYPPIGDGAASSLGVGCVGLERLAVMIGTSSAVRALWETDRVSIPEELWCYRLDARRPVLGGALNAGGNVVAWLRDVLDLPPDADRVLAEAEPTEHNLIMLPTLSGERSPGWHATAVGTLTGLTLATRPADILLALYEAVALRLAWVTDVIDRALPAPRRDLVGTGTALLANPAWQRIVADAMGRPLALSDVPEASLRGTALWAAERIGAIDSATAVPGPIDGLVQPDPKRHAVYRTLGERQRRLYEVILAQ